MSLNEESSAWWAEYYRKSPSRLSALAFFFNRIKLKAFQTVLYRELSESVKSRLQNGGPVRVLSAGSGVDFLAHRLKKHFGPDVDITIMDISAECIELNRRLFGEGYTFVTGDLFQYDFSTMNMDIVYNTGLLEHFDNTGKQRLLDRAKEALREGGLYITLNPSAGGKLYVKYMNHAMKKGTWGFAREEPIESLSEFSTPAFPLVREYQAASLNQSGFLYYGNKIIFTLLLPLIVLAMFFYIEPLDRLFAKRFGCYALVSMFKRTGG